MGVFNLLFKKNKHEKPKIGLALGSGGAKGFAELGVLKAFEENDIGIDVIGGTSVGSIIGACYANGYTSTDILSLLEKIDFSEIKSWLMINMDTSGLFKVIDRTIGTMKIEELKKPFVAVATEVETSEEVVFKSGDVAQVLCASSSYPPFFKPVIIDGKRYVDGAFSNSVPADRVKELGADIVIGVDLSSHESKAGMLSKFIPTYQGKTDTPWEKGYKYSDVMIHPDLSEYKPVSFFQGNEIYEIGYRAAIEKLPEIKNKINFFQFRKKSKK